MLTKIWLINALLTFFVVFFGFKAYGVWVEGNNGFEIPEIIRKSSQKHPKILEPLHKRKVSPESKYEVLMRLNLFTPERTEIIPEASKTTDASVKRSASDQKKVKQYFDNVTLYGLVITNDSAEALVSYPVEKPAREKTRTVMLNSRRRNRKGVMAKQTEWVKAGDTLGDFKVVSIEPDRVLLKAGDQSYDLLLYDEEQPKKRAPAKPKTGPNVVGVSVNPKDGSKATGMTRKAKTVPQAGKPSAKPPVLNATGNSKVPLPVKKRGF